MHQSQEYGVILLKQKYKQSQNFAIAINVAKSGICLNFAKQLAKQLPFEVAEIERGITELVAEGVLQIDEEKLSQKRMVKDAYLSDARAKAGSEGGKSKAKKENFANGFASDFAKAKNVANYEYVYVSETVNENEVNNKKNGKTSSRARARAEKSDLEKTIDDFMEMRKKMKRPMTDRAVTLMRNKLEKMAPDDEPKQILILEQSIERSWQGVFPLHNEQENHTQKGEKANERKPGNNPVSIDKFHMLE